MDAACVLAVALVLVQRFFVGALSLDDVFFRCAFSAW
jgi:hypothetical protein